MTENQPGSMRSDMANYIAGLNQIPQESDFALDDSYNFENDLALFTNTEFVHNDIIDFDLDFDFTQSIPGEEEYLKEQTTATSSIALAPIAPAPPAIAVAPSASAAPTTSLQQSASIPSAKASARKKQKSPARASKTTGSSTKARLSLQASAVDSASKVAASKSPLSITIPTPIESAATSSSQPPTSTQVGNGDMNFEGDFHFNDIGFTPQAISYGAAAAGGYDFNIPPQSPYDPKHQLSTPLTPVTTPPNGQQGVRPQGVLPDAAALLEASSRAAAEEDKRRRNTAASARFRYKKKQREQALEKSAKDMTDKLDKLEDKINQLEKENQWLRSLVVERTAKTSEEMAELYKTFKEEERSKESHKKGVGTPKNEN